MTQNDWSERLAGAVAKEVRRHRKRQGMSAQELADRCANLGMPLKRSVLANLESGRRTTVTLAELIVLARALGVPPLLLAFPVAQEEHTEVLPGQTVGTWAAAKWFTGDDPFPTRDKDSGNWFVTSDDFDEWQSGAEAIDRMRWQDRYFAQLSGAHSRAEGARKAAETASTSAEREAHLRTAEAEQRTAEAIEREIRFNRNAMRKAGLTPPELRPESQHLDDITAEDRRGASGQ
ncbi:helix-turn-helix domain-containing protein [Marinactinospora rubrisoli]|uniref:Helix-turn-helix domain-containing protein n=1 Tax=Marinactinospora rubrisoli TaxID=2715399 RepID=A0ABW2K8G3_9ACTN